MQTTSTGEGVWVPFSNHKEATPEPAANLFEKIRRRCDEQTLACYTDIIARFHHASDTVEEVRVSSTQIESTYYFADDGMRIARGK